MIEMAAHLVDHVLPQVPMRQWVLSFPWPLRLLFAARPEVLTQVLNVATRALVRTGVLVEDPEQPGLDIHPDSGSDNALEQLAGAAVCYRIAVDPIAGRKTMMLHSPVPDTSNHFNSPCTHFQSPAKITNS